MINIEQVTDPTLIAILKKSKNRSITKEMCDAISEFKKVIMTLQSLMLIDNIKTLIRLQQ